MMVGLPDSLTESTNRQSTSHQDHKAFVEVHCAIYLLVFQKKIDSKKLPDLYILSDLSKVRKRERKMLEKPPQGRARNTLTRKASIRVQEK